MSTKTKKTDAAKAAEPEAEAPAGTVVWDDSAMATHFSNVVNIQSTQEQVDLFFGTNQTWDVGGSGQQVKVELSNRIIMSPHAAKRLMMALNGVIQEYENRYGAMNITPNG